MQAMTALVSTASNKASLSDTDAGRGFSLGEASLLERLLSIYLVSLTHLKGVVLREWREDLWREDLRLVRLVPRTLVARTLAENT